MAGLVSRVCPGGPNTVQWTVRGTTILGGSIVDSMTGLMIVHKGVAIASMVHSSSHNHSY